MKMEGAESPPGRARRYGGVAFHAGVNCIATPFMQ